MLCCGDLLTGAVVCPVENIRISIARFEMSSSGHNTGSNAKQLLPKMFLLEVIECLDNVM